MIEVVAAILFNDNDKVFISRRKSGKPLAGYWEFPGGKIEEGETPEEGLRREIFEELNIQIEIESFFGENIHDYGEFSIRLLTYKGCISDGEITLTDHDAFEWVSVEELQKFIFAPADIPFVDALMSPKEILGFR